MYTYEQFLKAAQDCNNHKTEFIRRCRRLYEHAKAVGWYDNHGWETEYGKDRNDYIVYCYKNEATKSVYVGLTCHPKRRFVEHKCNGTVHDFFETTNTQLPSPEILETNLSTKDAQRQEGFYVDKYRNEGWNIINRKKTGEHSSSLGGNCRKLTREYCFEVFKQYKTKTALQKGNVSVYRKSLENGWLDVWYTNMSTKKWTRETAYNEAKSCNSKMDLRAKNQYLYNYVRKNGWLDDYTWFRHRKTEK